MPDDCIIIALGLPGVRVIHEEETDQQIVIEVQYRVSTAICPGYGRRTSKVHSVRPQRKRDRRLWDKPMFLVLHKRRFRCLNCAKASPSRALARRVSTEPDPVCGARRRSSRRFRDYLGEEALQQPVRHVARREGVGEAMVCSCLTEAARRLLEAPEQPLLARILGLDELSIRKGQVYDTAIMDVEHRQVLG